MSGADVPSVGWYVPSQFDTAQPNGLKGLDSWIEIGYLRPYERSDSAGAEIPGGADNSMEFQEIILGSYRSAAPAIMDDSTAWNQAWFYADSEDWNSAATITHGDLNLDWNGGANTTEDWNSAPNGFNEDWNSMDFPTITWASETFDDLMADTGIDDLNGVTLGLPEITYDMHMLASLDGITVAQFEPELVRFDTETRMFSISTTGSLHRLRLEATDPWQAYHVKYLAATITYNGRLG
jgi:hypothetical protein